MKHIHRWIQELKLGEVKIERRRREPSRGAKGAKAGKGVGKGCPLPHLGEGLGRGQCPLPQFFLNFVVKMAYFRRLLVLNFVFFYDQNSIEIH